VEYCLSDRGRSLRCAIVPIADWVMEHRDGIEHSQQIFDQGGDSNAGLGDR
jgi:DNA-binding HxlR family transcriptional regulator